MIRLKLQTEKSCKMKHNMIQTEKLPKSLHCLTIEEVEKKQDEFNEIIGVLEDYTLRADKYIGAKNKLSNNAKKFYERREKIAGFKNGIFPFDYDEVYEEQMRYEKKEEQ